MAIDETLLRNAQRGTASLRLYRWSPPCLSFGRNEPALVRYDSASIDRLGLDTVRRPTGGRAVWHDHEVTYAVAAPIAVFGSLKASYTTIHSMLVSALRTLGVSAELAAKPSTPTAPLSSGACFAAPVGGEIVASGGKLVGSAQLRDGGALLQHGSLLLSNTQDIVGRVTRNAPSRPMATSLEELLHGPISFEEVVSAIVSAAQRHWRGNWTTCQINGLTLQSDRFTDPAWTWRR